MQPYGSDQPAGYPPVPPPPPGRTPWPLIIGLVAALVLVTGGVVTAVLLTAGGRKHPAASSATSAAPGGWTVGSCIYVAKDSPLATSSVLNPATREAIEESKEYALISCGDPKAVAKITALGAQVQPGKPLTASGCPDDTDFAVRTKTSTGRLESQVYCTRNLKPPHPGDPGGGSGALVVGDCVYIGSSNGAKVLNDEVAEIPCSNDGYFAKVLAKTPDKAACPAGTISRIPLGDPGGTLLCLGRGGGDGGRIANAGDCLWTSANTYMPATRDNCTPRAPERLDSFADSAAQCPKGTHGRQFTGYDRILCVRYSDGS
jgi:hypothetical protein